MENTIQINPPKVVKLVEGFIESSEPNVYYTGVQGNTDPITDYTVEWFLIREKRDKLLQESDWTQLPDVPITTKEEWAAYRQQLRDITDQSDPLNIVWPTPPA